MQTVIKLAVTAAFAAAIAWPLLFWGKPALPEHGVSAMRPSFHNTLHQQDVVW